ncbi:unnamed protein product [Heterobilharzia americana]|nr:unnamed protein product [Heterobilharzia americana]
MKLSTLLFLALCILILGTQIEADDKKNGSTKSVEMSEKDENKETEGKEKKSDKEEDDDDDEEEEEEEEKKCSRGMKPIYKHLKKSFKNGRKSIYKVVDQYLMKDDLDMKLMEIAKIVGKRVEKRMEYFAKNLKKL